MKRFSNGLVAIIVATFLMGIVSLPDSIKATMPSSEITDWLKEQKVTLGLDLQGGTQLDYRVDLRNAIKRNEDADSTNDIPIRDVVEGVLATIERRVNGLGVSEPQIYTSNVGGEIHIIVELAGIKDIQKAKDTVGKTIQLEFMEPKTEADEGEFDELNAEVAATLAKALEPETDFRVLGDSIRTNDGKIRFEDDVVRWASEMDDFYQDIVPRLREGQVYNQVVDAEDSGRRTKRIFQLLKKESQEKSGRVRASHILITYEGAQRAAAGVTRTKEEAQILAQDLLNTVTDFPENFEDTAEAFSDGPSGAKGGDLDFFGKNAMAPAFEATAFSLKKGETATDLTETPFGYHIIKVTDTESGGSENVFTFNEILYDATPSLWKPSGLDGSQFKYASVNYDQYGNPQVSIEFDKDGAILFEELTDRLKGSNLAIFVGGQLISAPSVSRKIVGGNAVITGSFNLQRALELANDLNTGAIDAPIILTGQFTISATLGENALELSLFAGMIGLLALALFMIAYYRLLGIFAVISLLIYAVIIVFILKTTPIVMTLAGIAGIILSIGMAVDANILIFERTKEELNEGKNFTASVTTGFERAWSSIRDSNVSSLITCVILWFFGNSIIKGFALMLGIGILISMFTAINVTRAFLHTLAGTRASKSNFLLGTKKVENQNR